MLTASSSRTRRTWSLLLAVAMAVGASIVAMADPAAAQSSTTTSSTKCADPSGKVKVGLSYFGGVSNNLQGIGADQTAQLTPADQAIVDGYQRGIDYLNQNGGLAGCQVQAVTFNFKASAPDFNQLSQQECAAFTQDNKVIAVYAPAFETKVAVDCYAKAKTPLFQIGNNYAPTCQDETKYAGFVYAPTGIATCRFGSFIGVWKNAGLFPANPKVGILALDDGSGQGTTLANKIWTPALKKLKIPAETFTYPAATSESGFAATSAAMANGILKFKADGVNVVLFTPSGAQGVASFMPQAATQNFFPNYGLDTADALQIAQTLGGSAIKKGIAISWAFGDLPLSEQNQLPANSAATGCAKWKPPAAAAATIDGSSTYCDFINLLQAGFKGATATDAKTLRKGIEALGTSFVSSITYGGATKFGPGRYDGAYQVRLLQYDPNTKSFPFKSGSTKTITIP
jgi:hypothetical protein